MDALTVVALVLSITLQLLAALLACRLIPHSRGGGMVWLLLAVAIFLMTARRVVTFVGFYRPAVTSLFTGPVAEVLALTISCLMLAAVVLAPKVFRTLEASLAAEQRSAAAAREAVRVREEFLSVASHELRTPLTSLKLGVQGLASGALVASAEAFKKALGTVERQIGRMEALVDRLFDVTQIQAGQLQLRREEIDLARLVRDCVDRLAEAARQAGCDLVVHAEVPVVCHVDPLRIEQVVTNLITNSLKFGAGKPVEVSVERRAQAAYLRVWDRGIGIPAERLADVFERFERAVSAREYGGLGLGLYIARGIIDAHGGTIAVASTPGQGSCFTIQLPCT